MTDDRNVRMDIDDCWNRKGVWGGKDCDELKRVLHCNNCEVYSNAGRKLLDQVPSEGYEREWTGLIAEKSAEEAPGQESAFVFRLGPEWFAIPSGMLVEVLMPSNPHTVPHRCGPVFKGLVNVRGELHLCVSLSAILDVDGEAADNHCGNNRRMLLLNREGEQIVFPANEVYGIIRFRDEDLAEVPATLAKATANYVRGLLEWDRGHVSVLDDRQLFKRIGRSLL